jgi:diphthine synthase
LLLIIGIGLDTKDISVKALEELKDADYVLLDQHTNRISEDYINYIKGTSKNLKFLSRSDLEENIKTTISEAKESKVALLVSGDPLIATTHNTILLACREEGIEYKIMHSSSIITAVMGESGLIPYRFGQTTTMPFWTQHYKPISFIDVILRNIDVKAHTIVLLDYDYTKNINLKIKDALQNLIDAAKEKGTGKITKDTLIIALGDVGKPTQKIIYASIGELQESAKELSELIFTIVVPAEINFIEKEVLKLKYERK